jgi:hypothetical protein
VEDMKKIIIILVVLGISFVGYTYASTPLSGDVQGGIHIEVVDEVGVTIISDYYDFEEEVSLFDILQENYALGCADSGFKMDDTCSYKVLNNHMILAIEDVETDWYNSFLEITINGDESQYGVDSIMVEDDTVYTFTYTSLGGGE